jgi:hypothetical protein
MIYILKIMNIYEVPLLELCACNRARYPQSTTPTLICYRPQSTIYYLENGFGRISQNRK